jgi:hypothetical protein
MYQIFNNYKLQQLATGYDALRLVLVLAISRVPETRKYEQKSWN